MRALLVVGFGAGVVCRRKDPQYFVSRRPFHAVDREEAIVRKYQHGNDTEVVEMPASLHEESRGLTRRKHAIRDGNIQNLGHRVQRGSKWRRVSPFGNDLQRLACPLSRREHFCSFLMTRDRNRRECLTPRQVGYGKLKTLSPSFRLRRVKQPEQERACNCGADSR